MRFLLFFLFNPFSIHLISDFEVCFFTPLHQKPISIAKKFCDYYYTVCFMTKWKYFNSLFLK
jgi:hypothetical protein